MALWEWYEKKNKKKYFESEKFTKIFLKPPKAELENRIKKRFDKMIRDGAIKETENFNKLNIGSILSSNFIIGIKEISEFLNKKIKMKELKEKVLIRSRQYAKRQYTWQRGQMKEWKGFEDTNYLDLRKKVLSYLSKT
jgi:tRNA dimethylallyltransferase